MRVTDSQALPSYKVGLERSGPLRWLVAHRAFRRQPGNDFIQLSCGIQPATNLFYEILHSFLVHELGRD